MSATTEPGRAASAAPPRKRAPRTTINVTAEVDVDVDIDEFDDETVLAHAAEIYKSRGALPPECCNVNQMAAAAYLAHIEGNCREFDRLSREIIGEILGKIL